MYDAGLVPRHPAHVRYDYSELTKRAESIMSLRLGSTAPNFDAETTQGKINFHDFVGSSWVVFFSQ